MQVNVRLGEPLWRSVGRRSLVLSWPEETEVAVGDVLARLAVDYPSFAAAFAGQGLVQSYPYRVFIDSRLVQPAGPTAHPDRANFPTPVRDGQTVYLLVPAVGG